MSEHKRYIEVVASARVSRTVETYRAKIEINVTTRKRQSCLAESLTLRDQIVELLVQSGIDAGHIEEGGGNVSQSHWSSSKTVVHELRVKHPDMSVLIDAMAKVEDHYSSLKDGWFSGVKRDFTFTVPSADFVDDSNAAEDALKHAVQKARTKAAHLAEEANLRLGNPLFIVQVPQKAQHNPQAYYAGMEDSILDDEMAMFDAGPIPSYTPTAPMQEAKQSHFRVRFEAFEGA